MFYPVLLTENNRKSLIGSRKEEGVRESLRLSIFALLLFLSGVAALIHQILWIKQLSLIVGVDGEPCSAFTKPPFHAYRGERELWARNLEEVMKEDPANPYYGSIIIGSALGESRRPAGQ